MLATELFRKRQLVVQCESCFTCEILVYVSGFGLPDSAHTYDYQNVDCRNEIFSQPRLWHWCDICCQLVLVFSGWLIVRTKAKKSEKNPLAWFFHPKKKKNTHTFFNFVSTIYHNGHKTIETKGKRTNEIPNIIYVDREIDDLSDLYVKKFLRFFHLSLFRYYVD